MDVFAALLVLPFSCELVSRRISDAQLNEELTLCFGPTDQIKSLQQLSETTV